MLHCAGHFCLLVIRSVMNDAKVVDQFQMVVIGIAMLVHIVCLGVKWLVQVTAVVVLVVILVCGGGDVVMIGRFVLFDLCMCMVTITAITSTSVMILIVVMSAAL